MNAAGMRFGSLHQLREQGKAVQDAQVAQQQIFGALIPLEPSDKISPKDALLDFTDADAAYY